MPPNEFSKSRDRRFNVEGLDFEPEAYLQYQSDNFLQNTLSRNLIFNGTFWVPAKATTQGLLKVTSPKSRLHGVYIGYGSFKHATIADASGPGSTADGATTAAEGKMFLIRYLRLVTPPEVYANIYVISPTATSHVLLYVAQDENLDNTYDVQKIWGEHIQCTQIKVLATAKVLTTADRITKVYYAGVNVEKWV